MKIRILAAAALLAATVAAVQTSPASAAPGGTLNCTRFCMVALCPSPQTCGPFVNSAGNLVCGCHS